MQRLATLAFGFLSLGPIFVREWITVPRRHRHYILRSAYLGILWILGLTAWQVTIGWTREVTLGDLARFGPMLFEICAAVQLVLLLFFAAVSGASTVTREKDRRTFILLLITDLRNYEIVLGKLFGSLLQIGLLMLGAVPIMVLIVLLGGVSLVQVLQTTLILAATAVAAGSLGCLVALWRDKTFQTLALTVLFLVLYFCVIRIVAYGPGLLVDVPVVGPWVAAGMGGSWPQILQWLDPFVALSAVLDEPSPVAFGYTAVMIGFSAILNGLGIWRLRIWNPSGEPVMQREQPEDAVTEEKDRMKAHAAPGRVREVWANPILWREMRTYAYGRWPLLVKAAYVLVVGLIAYFGIVMAMQPTSPLTFKAAYGLVPVAIISLLIVSAQAVTAITSERDGRALDLLLVTDLTPKEFIFGKLLGICYNAKEYLLAPILLTILYAVLLKLAAAPRGHPEMLLGKNVAAGICVVGTLLVLLAFTVVVGLHSALRIENSQLAVLHTLGTVFFLSIGTLTCIYLILINRRFEYQWFSFIFFIAAGIGGLWWVLNASRPSHALTLAAWACPLAMFYAVTNVIIGKPGSEESTDPYLPFLVVAGAFGFTVTAMLVPLLSEFDVALGRTTGGEE